MAGYLFNFQPLTTTSPDLLTPLCITMTSLWSQITSLTIVDSTVYSGANQRKHQSYMLNTINWSNFNWLSQLAINVLNTAWFAAWGHLRDFHWGMSPLKWNKMVCMGVLAYSFILIKSMNMFSMSLQSGVPRHFHYRLIAVWHRTSQFLCVCISKKPPNFSENMHKHGYFLYFQARKKISRCFSYSVTTNISEQKLITNRPHNVSYSIPW